MAQKHVRMYPRVAAGFAVECESGGATVRERATTLGGGGLFLKLKDPPPLGTVFMLRFRAAKHLPVVETTARVCYVEPGQGAALEFTEISPEDRRQLLRVILRKSGHKRLFDRAPLPTQIQCEECMSIAFSREVSAGGMFIELNRPLPTGSRLTLRFNLDDGGPIVVAIAEVTYEVEQLGMGVQFVELSDDDRKRINAYVARANAAVPDAAQ